MTEHTAGPWATDGEEIVDAKNHCSIALVSNDRPRFEWEANARLIAAVPDLLEALKTAYVLIEADIIRDDAGCLDKIRNAIAKAEGREE